MKICFIIFFIFFNHFCFCQLNSNLVALDSIFQKDLEQITEPSNLSGTKYFDYHSGIKKAYLFNGNFN